jgi:transcriptional regulator of acetoin/glycerol metabolism
MTNPMALLQKDGDLVTRTFTRVTRSTNFSVIARPDLVKPLEQVEKDAVESAMILCLGDVEEAARRLGLSRATMYRKLAKYAQ